MNKALQWAVQQPILADTEKAPETQQPCTKHPRMPHADFSKSLQQSAAPLLCTQPCSMCARLAQNLYDSTHPPAMQLRLQLVLAEERASQTTQEMMNHVKQTAPQSHHNQARQEERTRKELPATDCRGHGMQHAAQQLYTVFQAHGKVSRVQHVVKLLSTTLLRKVAALASSHCCSARSTLQPLQC